MLSDRLIFLLLLAASLFPTAQSFHPVLKSATTTSQPLLLCHHRLTALAMSQSHQDTKTDDAVEQCPHPFSELPGDPSLLLVTNLDLGDKKLDIMKGISKAMAEATGKPESYIGVSITHNASVIFGGTDEPCALGNMYSIGSIAMESNGKVQAAVTDLLEPFGLAENRIYINFFDMPRANVGWSRRTFAG